MLLDHPYNINPSNKFSNGQYYSHTLNGIRVFVKEESPEGYLINALTSSYGGATPDPSTIERFIKWEKTKGFDWDKD